MTTERGETLQNRPANSGQLLERAKGIEPSYAAWEAAVLPLNYARKRIPHFCAVLPDCRELANDGTKSRAHLDPSADGLGGSAMALNRHPTNVAKMSNKLSHIFSRKKRNPHLGAVKIAALWRPIKPPP